MDKERIKEYFTTNAEDWLKGGYQYESYTYPTAHHRARLVNSIILGIGNNLNIVDLGSGGGNLSILLAKEGHRVVGVDQSPAMIDIANNARERLSSDEKNKVRFILSDLEKSGLEKNHFDVMTAMGLIGYLATDDVLFNLAKKLLKPRGKLIVSCRNRLFNMVSLSFRTINEIKKGEAIALLSEIEDLYQQIPKEDVARFLSCLTEDVNALDCKKFVEDTGVDQNNNKDFNALEARQHTPKRLKEAAEKLGFNQTGCFGVHPHLMDPRINRLLPPNVFNQISRSLELLEHLPVSLVWSSVFISVFEKKEG